MFFGVVLGVCWKSLFKRFNIGAVLMFFVMLITMFVAADAPGCLKGNTLEGSCSVKVKTNASTIKATMEIKGGSGDFNGSITIGSCTIKGTFSLGIQTFAPDNNGGISYRSPITIEATKTEVTFKVGTNPKKTFCPSAPFDVQGGEIIRTTIALKLDSGNMVSLKLADSVKIDNDDQSKKNQLPVWGIVLICVGSSVLFIAIVVIIGVVLCCCCCKKNKKTNQKQDGQKKPIGVGNSKAQEKKQPAVAPEFKIPDQFEWPTDDFTTEQLDLLLECFPAKKITNVELSNRIFAFLKKHPVKTKKQWDTIKKIFHAYNNKLKKEILMNRDVKPTRTYCITAIFDILVGCRPTSESSKKV
ncbi:hypothetical protein M3Y94_01007900 [Aphelenchoides besseyi]|nr:hypothetical protein M3Y94_01007900 [Aphelenchoides besseyi]